VAHAFTRDDSLVVTTGAVQRTWRWVGTGFATQELRELTSQRAWALPTTECDWNLPDGSDAPNAVVEALSAAVSDDDGFTSKHICVTAEIGYADAGLLVRFTVWAYPDAPGVRTQLAVQRRARPGTAKDPPAARDPFDICIDRVPPGDPASRRRYFGYYNGTQQRNETHLDLLKEEVVAHTLSGREWCDWASVACIEDGTAGVALVKESHKCVNQPGHLTGGFACDDDAGLWCTGWGLGPDEISCDAFTPAWATWSLAWSGGDLERELAFKRFDRARYPIDPDRDVYIQANTWGSTRSGVEARRAAAEAQVLDELESCAELGIDVLQIDDGWQVPPGSRTWQPDDSGWQPDPGCHPNGWAPVRARAEELGVKLGLWAAAMPISLQELQANYANGGFVQFKLDFARLRNRAEIDALMGKVRAFVAWTGQRVRINWDVTENAPRYGYFFAREYGCIYLENRKPEVPYTVVYRPHTVLRDLWQVARYLNLHRFQCSIQNVDHVNPRRSDAGLHPHSYAVAIALMGIPLFFLQTKLYTAAAKAEIRSLLDIYKQHRDAIYAGIVHPIGGKPDNASWTGFQCHLAEEHHGFLTIFRERCNGETRHSFELGWLRDTTVRITDLMEGTTRTCAVGADGVVEFEIGTAPGFLFCSYAEV
jgi:hypothetical protein